MGKIDFVSKLKKSNFQELLKTKDALSIETRYDKLLIKSLENDFDKYWITDFSCYCDRTDTNRDKSLQTFLLKKFGEPYKKALIKYFVEEKNSKINSAEKEFEETKSYILKQYIDTKNEKIKKANNEFIKKLEVLNEKF